ncbi:ribonuclease H-like domain-containing protein [Mycena polygramma]|nr:ribonuclease H-like domain-containing protein [Mycena polygramma]
MAESKPLSDYFHRGTKQNSSHYHTYCKACVKHHLDGVGATAADLIEGSQAFKDACTAVGNTRGDKLPWVTHILGGQGATACVHASAQAKEAAVVVRKELKQKAESKEKEKGTESKKRSRTQSNVANESADPPPAPKKQHVQTTLSSLAFRRNDMPFGPAEKDAFQAQALRAVISSGSPFQLFEDPEMKILLGMLRTTAPDVIPTGKVIGGRLLNEAAEDVERVLQGRLKNRNVGLSTDGWKSRKKDAINAICANVDFKSHLLELVDLTDQKKDGPSQCRQFAAIIDRIELKNGCIVIYFTTDADGGSKKGRLLLGKERPWLILPSCWAHQKQFQLILGDYFKVYIEASLIAEDATALIGWINNHGRVRKVFDESQAAVSMDRNAGRIIVLVYLVANLTRWTTHFVAFKRLFLLREALHLAVLQKRNAIIAAAVGAATSTEGQRLKEDAERMCALIEDKPFWTGLETILEDLEPICLGTNINQKDSTRLDQVLLTIAGIFLRFADHPEQEVRNGMLVRLEKRWKDCDQPVFLLALILNPFEKLSCFGPNANLNQLKCRNLLILVYRRINSRPDNEDTPEQRTVKENEVSKAFMQYLSGTGDFDDFDAVDWEETYENTDPIKVWEAVVDSRHLSELAKFAIIILNIVANQAGCERTFSRTKIEQSGHRHNLGLEKMDKRTKLQAKIKSEHAEAGLLKPRKGRKNHKSTATLLSVPRYRDLLEDADDEDPSERGRALVSSAEGWRTEVAKWIGAARAAERDDAGGDDVDEDEEVTPRLPGRLPAWKPLTLQVLFGGADKPRARKPSTRVMEEEEILMQALAEEEEDRNLDDGAIEIDSDEEYCG